MEVRIVEEHANPLLQRTEYRFEVAHPGAATPKRDDVRGELAKLTRQAKDRIVVEHMEARFGTATTRGEAFAYASTEALKRIARDHIQVRNGLKPKAGAPPAGEAGAEGAAKPEPAAEQAADKPADKPAGKPAEKPADKPAGKPAEKLADKPAGKPAEKAVVKPAGKSVEKPAEKAAKKEG